MKKVGTLSSALSFIFFGIWMIVTRMDSELGYKIFKFWPVVFIILGIEILYFFGKKHSETKVGFSPLIIFVIITFLVTNAWVGVKHKVKIPEISDNEDIIISDIFDALKNTNGNYKSVDVNYSLENMGKTLTFDMNNADVSIFKSENASLKVEGYVEVDRRMDIKDYKPQVQNGDNTVISIKEGFVKKCKVKIYIPEEKLVNIKGNNLKIESEESIKSSLNIKCNNAKLDLENVSELNVDMNNGTLRTKDVNNIKLKSNNASIKVIGNTESLNCSLNNGAVSIYNNTCKDIKVNMNRGDVKLKTEDKNIDVNIQLGTGMANINDIQKVNSNLTKVYGNGEGKVNIKVDTGKVAVEN